MFSPNSKSEDIGHSSSCSCSSSSSSTVVVLVGNIQYDSGLWIRFGIKIRQCRWFEETKNLIRSFSWNLKLENKQNQ